jgi:hypothetical protein
MAKFTILYLGRNVLKASDVKVVRNTDNQPHSGRDYKWRYWLSHLIRSVYYYCYEHSAWSATERKFDKCLRPENIQRHSSILLSYPATVLVTGY